MIRTRAEHMLNPPPLLGSLLQPGCSTWTSLLPGSWRTRPAWRRSWWVACAEAPQGGAAECLGTGLLLMVPCWAATFRAVRGWQRGLSRLLVPPTPPSAHPLTRRSVWQLRWSAVWRARWPAALPPRAPPHPASRPAARAAWTQCRSRCACVRWLHAPHLSTDVHRGAALYGTTKI